MLQIWMLLEIRICKLDDLHANWRNFNINIHFLRDVKSNEKETKKDQNNRGRNSRGKDARPNNKRTNPNLVQTMGFLSEGIADGAHSKRGKFKLILMP